MTQQNPPKNETLLLSSQLDLNFADTLNTINAHSLAVQIINARSQQKRLRGQLTLINTQNMQLDYYAFNYAMLCE